MSMINRQIALTKATTKKNLLRVVILLLPVFVLWGCESTPDVEEDTSATPVSTTTDSGASTSAADSGSGATAKPMPQAAQEDTSSDLLSKNIVYFDFDRNDIKDEFKDIITAHANYLASNPSAKMTLEGHADERGTREYNIGLGDRRANAVRQLLVLQGASSSQVDSISYGEERPMASGHDESSWEQNRRAELVYSSR